MKDHWKLLLLAGVTLLPDAVASLWFASLHVTDRRHEAAIGDLWQMYHGLAEEVDELREQAATADHTTEQNAVYLAPIIEAKPARGWARKAE